MLPGILIILYMWWHLLALLVACIWGSTFASSSILIDAGLTPAEILCLRFLIAYVLMLPFCRKAIVPRSPRDEGLFILLGLCGGSLYFLTENYAIKLTDYTSTVALVVSTTPIYTALIHHIFWKTEHLGKRFLSGTVVALCGVSMVVLNGIFVLDDNPWVILLSFLAALCWAFYGIILKVLERRYHSDVITRKIFFWGLVTIIPIVFVNADTGDSTPLFATHGRLLLQSKVWTNLLYLALIASLFCFLVWSIVCRRLTVVTASNYLYFNPVASLIIGSLLLDETLTAPAVMGCALTISGVYLCNSHHLLPSAVRKRVRKRNG